MIFNNTTDIHVVLQPLYQTNHQNTCCTIMHLMVMKRNHVFLKMSSTPSQIGLPVLVSTAKDLSVNQNVWTLHCVEVDLDVWCHGFEDEEVVPESPSVHRTHKSLLCPCTQTHKHNRTPQFQCGTQRERRYSGLSLWAGVFPWLPLHLPSPPDKHVVPNTGSTHGGGRRLSLTSVYHKWRAKSTVVWPTASQY